jgi:DNA-binding transcriptional LysR family regulator
MRLDQLRQLVVVAQKGNFRRASKDLGISQPALTRSIQKLEDHFGVPLLDRLTSGVIPTTYGRVVVDWADKTIASSENLKRQVGLLEELFAGTFVVGTGPYFSDFILAEIISKVLKKHPQLKITVKMDQWRNLEELLLSHEIDLFLGYIDEVKNPKEITVKELLREPVAIFCRKGHPLLNSRNLKFEDIFQYPLAGPAIPENLQEAINKNLSDLMGPEVGGQPLLSIKFDSYSEIRRIVELSDCIGGLPDSSVKPFLRDGKLVQLPISIEGLFSSAGIAYLKDRTLLPSTELFIEEISKRMSGA